MITAASLRAASTWGATGHWAGRPKKSAGKDGAPVSTRSGPPRLSRSKFIWWYSTMASKTFVCARYSYSSLIETPMSGRRASGADWRISSRRSPLAYGSGLSRTPSITLKIAAFAPMPSPRVTMATSANAGLRSRVRAPKRISLSS